MRRRSRVSIALRRRSGRKLAEHALRHHPECRRLSGRPRFLDAEHQIETDGRRGSLSRAPELLSKQLDNELERVIVARGKGLVPPGFLIDKALTQLRQSRESAAKGGKPGQIDQRRTREKNIAGNWAERARNCQKEVAPALERQIAEMELQRRLATEAPACPRDRMATNITAGRSRLRPPRR
jgi:uncharacterized protein (DUF885 family)